MANQAVEQFIEAIVKSPDLLAKSREAIQGSADAERFAELGRENGFEFTKAEAQGYFQQALGVHKPGELSDEELAKIAGGKDDVRMPASTKLSVQLFQSLSVSALPGWTGYL